MLTWWAKFMPGITNLMKNVSCKERILLGILIIVSFTFLHRHSCLQTTCLKAMCPFPIISSFFRGTFIYSVVITLDQIIPARHLYGFISDWLVIYMRERIRPSAMDSVIFSIRLSQPLLGKNHYGLTKKNQNKNTPLLKFSLSQPKLYFLTNLPPHHPLNFLCFFLDNMSGNL